jgi:hypothetical protein
MLASLLPGLRDLRAPLSAGYLWLTAGWLYFAPQLPASINDTRGVLKDIYRVVHADSPLAVGVGLTFAAYIVGILSTGLLTRPVRVITRSSFGALLLPVIIPLIILEQLGERWPIAQNKFEDTTNWVDRGVNRFSASPLIRARKLVIRRMSSKVLTDRQYRDVFLHSLQERLETFSGFSPGLSSLRRLHSIRFLLDDPSQDKQKRATEVLDRLSRYIDDGYLYAAEILVQSLVDVDRHAQNIVDELKLVPERIVGDKPATYERWDRLSAEGEFRQAVVPPLVAIIASLFSRGVLHWPSGLLLILPPLVILLQGIGKENEAQGQLIQTLEAGVVTAPVIDRLTTTELHWLR